MIHKTSHDHEYRLNEEDNLGVETPRSNAYRSLKAGGCSLAFHLALLICLVVSSNISTHKVKPTVYRVSIRSSIMMKKEIPKPIQPPPSLLRENRAQKEDKRIVQKKEPIKEEGVKQELIQSIQPEPKMVQEEKKPPEPEEKNDFAKPIPLPVASDFFEEVDALALSIDRQNKNISYGSGTGDGTGSGKGSGIGSGEGGGIGHGKGDGSGIGGGTGAGYGVPGGSGKSSGMGQGGPGGGGGRGGGLAHPRYGENQKPKYPPEARERGHQGEVFLLVKVLPDGKVGEIEVSKSSGYDLLDRSALDAVKRWKFIPAKKGEIPISCWVKIPIIFKLR